MTKDIDLSEFVEIPHFTNYMASKDGRVYCKNGFFPALSTFPSSRGSYITLSVVRDEDGVRQDIVIHRLIALAFHYPGETWKVLEVNHKDGEKHHNHSDNLEWCTRSKNIEHSYRTGLRKDCRQFKVYDGDNQPIKCVSLNALSELTGYTVGILTGYIAIQPVLSRRLDNRWKIELDLSEGYDVSDNKSQSKALVCYNCKTKEIHHVRSSFEASMLMSVVFGTVLYFSKHNVNRRYKGMINGWLVWRKSDWDKNPNQLPTFSDSQIESNKNRHMRLCEYNLKRYESNKSRLVHE